MTSSHPMIIEVWEPVPGHPGYEASNLGGVRSIDRWINRSNGRSTYKQLYRGRDLHIHVGTHGYLQAGGLGPVHVLMMLTFHGEPPEGHEVAHYDGNKLNNTLDNLRYATRSENVGDTLRHGTLARGERNGQAKLTETDVIAIRSMHGSQRVIANKFNVCQTVICGIKRRERWGWL